MNPIIINYGIAGTTRRIILICAEYNLTLELDSQEEVWPALTNALDTLDGLWEKRGITILPMEPEDLVNASESLTTLSLSIALNRHGGEGRDACHTFARMYEKWAAKENIRCRRVLDHEDGIDYLVLVFDGDKKRLKQLSKQEHGIHRLVRIAPSDVQKRRHTTFTLIQSDMEKLSEDYFDFDIDNVVRSYILSPYHLVRGRNGKQLKNVNAVLDGELELVWDDV